MSVVYAGDGLKKCYIGVAKYAIYLNLDNLTVLPTINVIRGSEIHISGQKSRQRLSRKRFQVLKVCKYVCLLYYM